VELYLYSNIRLYVFSITYEERLPEAFLSLRNENESLSRHMPLMMWTAELILPTRNATGL